MFIETCITILIIYSLYDRFRFRFITRHIILCLSSRYKNNNLVSQDLDNSEVHIIYKWWNASNAGLTNTDSQYVSRVLILTYSKLLRVIFFLKKVNYSFCIIRVLTIIIILHTEKRYNYII